MDYKQLEDILYRDAQASVAEFAQGPNNRQVYACAFDVNPQGSIWICINTVQGFAATRDRYGEAEEEIESVSGFKYNPGDFAHCDVLRISSELSELLLAQNEVMRGSDEEGWSRHWDLYMESCTRVTKRLLAAGALNVLDRTLDFIAYVSLFDDTDDNKAALIRCTVPDALFRHIFGT